MSAASRGQCEGAETVIESTVPQVTNLSSYQNGGDTATATVVSSLHMEPLSSHKDGIRNVAWWKLCIDIAVIAAFGIPILLLFLIGEPFKRGFNCADQSIRYPFKESTVKSIILYVIGMLINLIAIIVLEIQRINKEKVRTVKVCNRSVNRKVYEIYAVIIIFGFGMACSQFSTDATKYWVGRLRPHFYSVCDPVFSKTNLTEICSDPNQNQYVYVNDYYCRNEEKGQSYEKKLKEMRLSFPSGHSSFGMYTMLFFAMYLQYRWPAGHNTQLVKNCLQYLAIFFAIFVGMTRISDYKHHWSDVLGGLVLGGACAILTITHVWRYYFKNNYKSTKDFDDVNHVEFGVVHVNGNH